MAAVLGWGPLAWVGGDGGGDRTGLEQRGRFGEMSGEGLFALSDMRGRRHRVNLCDGK